MPVSRGELADRWWTWVSPGYDRAVALVGWHRWLDDLVETIGSGVVLDLGCGPGRLGQVLVSRGVDYVGLDRNLAMLRRSRRRVRGPSRGRLVRGDLTALPFRTGSFDVVVAAGVLGLLRAPQRRVALRELARVTRGEVRLLEPVVGGDVGAHRLRVRLLALAPDGPIRLAELAAAGLRAELVGPARLGRVYAQVRATPSEPVTDR